MSEKDEMSDLEKLLASSDDEEVSVGVKSEAKTPIDQMFDGSEYQENVEAPEQYVEKDTGVTWDEALSAVGGEFTEEHATYGKPSAGSGEKAAEVDVNFGQPDRIDPVLAREKVGDKVGSPDFMDMERNVMSNIPHDMNLVNDVPVDLTVELGRTRLPVKDVLKLATGTVVELDGLVGEAMVVKVNNLILAEGEVVVVNDRLGVRITNILNSHEKSKRF